MGLGGVLVWEVGMGDGGEAYEVGSWMVLLV